MLLKHLPKDLQEDLIICCKEDLYEKETIDKFFSNPFSQKFELRKIVYLN